IRVRATSPEGRSAARSNSHLIRKSLVGGHGGDMVTVRQVVEATHQGNPFGIAPTGRRVR
ncbi:MAG: hypothetical protein ACRDG9_02020, partial [Actinomycetota bacterium]